MPWKTEKRGSKWAVVKMDTGETVAIHDTEADAAAQVKALHANVKMSGARVAFEPFAKVADGQPIKLMPIGRWFRGDRELDITKELLQQVVVNFEAGLPAHKVGIDLDHEENAGKVGDVLGIAVLEGQAAPKGDGLYLTDYDLTDKGVAAVSKDGYDAVSAEIIWSLNDGAKYQDPRTGVEFDNVLVGVALTPRPFFGREVSIFSAKQETMADTRSQALGHQTEQTTAIHEEETMADKVNVEEFEAAKLQAETLTAENKVLAAEKMALQDKLTALETAQKAEKLAQRKTTLEAEARGYKNLSVEIPVYVEKFAALEIADKVLADWVRAQFAAHDVAAGAVTAEVGTDLEGIEDPAAKFEATVTTIQKADKLSYEDALVKAAKQHPTLAEAYAYRAAPAPKTAAE